MILPKHAIPLCLCLCFFSSLQGLLAGGNGGGEWSCYRGPLGNGSVAPSGLKLIENAKQARRLWQSEAVIPASWVSPNRFGVGRCGGYGGVVVADGRAYFYYYEPSGDFVEESQFRIANKKGKNAGREGDFKVDADDVVLCLDARTGKTLWRQRFAGTAFNPRVLGGLSYMTCNVVDGRVYACGIMGMVYCLDARTGNLAWKIELPARAKLVNKLNAWKADEKRYEKKWPKGKNRLFGERYKEVYVCSPAVTGNVVAVCDLEGGVIGLDARDGKRKWQVKGCLGRRGETPIPGIIDGKPVFFAGNKSGVTAIDVASGKVLWRHRDENMGAGFSLCVHGDYLLGRGRKGNKRKPGRGPVCYRVSASGLQEVWRHEETYIAGNGNTSGITVLGKYAYWITSQNNKAGGRPPGYLYCAELTTGKIVAKCDAPTAMYSSLVGMDGLLILSRQGGLHLFKADPSDLKPIGTVSSPSTYCTMPAVAGGLVFNRCTSRVECWQLKR